MTIRGIFNLTSHLGLNPRFTSMLVVSLPKQHRPLWTKPLDGGQLRLPNYRTERCSRAIVSIVAGRKNTSTRKFQQSKSRVSEAPKKLGAVGGAPVKSSQLPRGTPNSSEHIRLGKEQAIGQVVTAQANFMRVLVQRAGNQEASADAGIPVENAKEELINGGFGHLHTGDGQVKEELRSGHVPNFSVANGCKNSLEKEKEPELLCFTGEVQSFSPAKMCMDSPEKEKELELLCVVRNVLKKIGRRVLVGDRVLVTAIDWKENRGMIEDVIDRRSEILDPPVANVNHLLLVFSIDQPQIDEKVLSRFLVEVESTDIPFSLVLNKVDLVLPEVVCYWQDRLADWGYDSVLCSADCRVGLSDLTNLLKNKITVILGPSGVGKSSLINVLRDEKGLSLWNEVEEEEQSSRVVPPVNGAGPPMEQVFEETFQELRVGEVSMGSGRGRHTTRHVSLLRVPGGSGRLADTPGFSQPSLAKVTSTSLSDLFPEVERRIGESENGRCAFPNCLHVGEPFCAVGEGWDRYPHYVALLEEVRNREKVEKRVLGTKRESEVRYKVRADGVKQAEPRLALKKHRRESRKHLNQAVEEEFREEEELQADIDDSARDLL